MMNIRSRSFILTASALLLSTLTGCAGDPDAPPEIRRFTPEEMDQIIDQVIEVRIQARANADERYPDLNDLGQPIPDNQIRRRNRFLNSVSDGQSRIRQQWDMSFEEMRIMIEYRGGIAHLEEQYELDRLVGM